MCHGRGSPPPPDEAQEPSWPTKSVDSFGAPPFNLFAPFHLNEVLVQQGEGEGEREGEGEGAGAPRSRGRGRYRGGGGS